MLSSLVMTDAAENRRGRNLVALAIVAAALLGWGTARAGEPGPDAEKDTTWYVLPDNLAPPAPPPAPPARTDTGWYVLPDQQAPARHEPTPVAGGETTWYGWQTLLCDAGALGLWAVAIADSTPAVRDSAIAAGFAAYVLAAPAVHYARGNVRKGMASLGLRVGLPVLGALAGAIVGAFSHDGGGTDGYGGASGALGVAGFIAGGVTAVVIDAKRLAREPRKPGIVSSLQPVVVPAAGGGSFALAGRF